MTSLPRREALKSAAMALGLLTLGGAAAAAQGSGLKFEIYKDSKGGFRWRLKASNGRVIGSSGEAYKAKADCRNGIELIRKGAATATIEEQVSP